MKVEITNRDKNQLLSREAVTLAVSGTKTIPSKKELRQKIAALLDKNEDTIFIKNIKHNYGSLDISCMAMAYDNAEKAKEIEKEYVINRNLGIKKKKGEKAEEAAPAPVGKEKPAETGKQKAEAEAGEGKGDAKGKEGAKEEEKPAEGKTENKEAEGKDG